MPASLSAENAVDADSASVVVIWKLSTNSGDVELLLVTAKRISIGRHVVDVGCVGT
ncbi:MAG: hypothetical protein R3C49_06755 [Planctomycetaceae bacterium]